MAVLLMENRKNKMDESLWLKSGDLRSGKGVLMANVWEGGPALKSKDWELVFPIIREDLKNFGGAMAPQCIT